MMGGEGGLGGGIPRSKGDTCCGHGMKGGPGGTSEHPPPEPPPELRQRPQVIWQYPPAGAPLAVIKPAPHLPKSRCSETIH